MIHLEDVTKAYPSKFGRHTVLNGISVDFPPGVNTAIMGPNGAGKSTLMRLLSGAEMPDTGRIICNAAVSWPLGFKGGLHGSLSGKENVAFIARIYRRDYQQMLKYVEDFAEIGRFINEPIKNYSSGMKAKLSFGVSLAIQFDYYLIDEVMSVGDPKFRRKSKAALLERLNNATVILISHSASLMKEYCVRGLVLEGGRLIEYSNIDEAIAHYENMGSAGDEPVPHMQEAGF
jgi:capsular polysaccharide transport system ATP-binding protein